MSLLLTSTFLYVNKPVVNMREKPTHESTVVSQAIFSEEITIEKEFEDWVCIKTSDQYTGWIPKKSFIKLEKPYETDLKITRLRAHIYGVKDTEYGPIKTLPYGAKLQALDTTDQRWIKAILPDGKECYVQKGDVAPEKELEHKEDLATFSQKFLNLPYTWGGRSSFGYDCSGFVQMLYNQIGINLLRDSKLQVLDDRFQTIPMDYIEKGDLIFFGREEGKISHVGMYIGNDQFIHATVRELQPWIRISSIHDLEWSGTKETTLSFRLVRQLIKK